MNRRSLLFPLLLLSACAAETLGDGAGDVTSAVGDEYTIEYESFVYVPAGAGEDQVRRAIQRQIKSSLGALREQGIGVLDRDAQDNLARSDWMRVPMAVVDAGGAEVDRVERVTYRYRDTALVERGRARDGGLPLVLLAGDYQQRYDDLVPACTDDADPYADSLWYHFQPGRYACQRRIRDERTAIADASDALTDPSGQIALVDRDRLFVETRATLVGAARAATPLYPEYDRLWGFAGNTDRTHVVAYAFFGVDSDLADPGDYGLREMLRFQRTLRRRFPALAVTHTEPFAWLLDFWVDGQKVAASFDDVERWIIDGTGFPPEADSAARREALKQQVIERFAERWIYWELPVAVRRGGETREMTVQLRLYYGYEDGSPEVRQRATWRYLEAFWHGDIFAYTGHSHFGHGPLAPFYYGAHNFPDRYQVMLVNSCLSFNYYDQDFIDIHPGGSANLDVVTNGLAAYWHGMGEAAAGYLIGLIDGENRSWTELLSGMQVDLPWRRGYDPLRAVNGELDNRFDPADGAIEID